MGKKTDIIIDFLGNAWNVDCLGCGITNHTVIVPGDLVYEDEYFTIQQDPLIPIKGFMIINAKKHVQSITQLTDIEQHLLIDLIHKTIVNLKELNITNQITVIQEERSSHFHVWLVPYHEWMLGKYGVGNVREICEYAKNHVSEKDIDEILDTVTKLRNRFV